MGKRNIVDEENIRRSLAINKTREEMRPFVLSSSPTPTKPCTSVSQLEDRISTFFKKFENLNEDSRAFSYPTMHELAEHLGYPSVKSLYNELYSGTNPEYSAYIENAISRVRDLMLRKQMAIAEDAQKWEGVSNALDRYDKIEERVMPTEESKLLGTKHTIAVEKTKIIITDHVGTFLRELKNSNAVDVEAIEVSPKELPDE